MLIDLLLLASLSLVLLPLATITHKITFTWESGGATIARSTSTNDGAEANLDESIPASSTDLELTYALDVSELSSFYMVSDQALTVETNDGSTPDDTITLVANEPFVWVAASGQANPFSADVTALFATNASGAAAQLQIRALQDPTP